MNGTVKNINTKNKKGQKEEKKIKGGETYEFLYILGLEIEEWDKWGGLKGKCIWVL